MEATTRKEPPEAANALTNGAGDRATREKTWDELTDPERIGRLRREQIMMRELVQSQQALLERLMVHQHAGTGEMMVPMSMSGRAIGVAGRWDGLR